MYQIGRGRHHHAPHMPDLTSHQGRVRQRADTHPHIQTLLQQIHITIIEFQLALYSRVAAYKPGNRRRNIALTELHRRGNSQGTARLYLARTKESLGFINGSKNGAGLLQVMLPFRSQRQAAGGAIEQTHSKMRFQVRQQTNHRRQ